MDSEKEIIKESIKYPFWVLSVLEYVKSRSVGEEIFSEKVPPLRDLFKIHGNTSILLEFIAEKYSICSNSAYHSTWRVNLSRRKSIHNRRDTAPVRRLCSYREAIQSRSLYHKVLQMIERSRELIVDQLLETVLLTCPCEEWFPEVEQIQAKNISHWKYRGNSPFSTREYLILSESVTYETELGSLLWKSDYLNAIKMALNPSPEQRDLIKSMLESHIVRPWNLKKGADVLINLISEFSVLKEIVRELTDVEEYVSTTITLHQMITVFLSDRFHCLTDLISTNITSLIDDEESYVELTMLIMECSKKTTIFLLEECIWGIMETYADRDVSFSSHLEEIADGDSTFCPHLKRSLPILVEIFRKTSFLWKLLEDGEYSRVAVIVDEKQVGDHCYEPMVPVLMEIFPYSSRVVAKSLLGYSGQIFFNTWTNDWGAPLSEMGLIDDVRAYVDEKLSVKTKEIAESGIILTDHYGRHVSELMDTRYIEKMREHIMTKVHFRLVAPWFEHAHGIDERFRNVYHRLYEPESNESRIFLGLLETLMDGIYQFASINWYRKGFYKKAHTLVSNYNSRLPDLLNDHYRRAVVTAALLSICRNLAP